MHIQFIFTLSVQAMKNASGEATVVGFQGFLCEIYARSQAYKSRTKIRSSVHTICPQKVSFQILEGHPFSLKKSQSWQQISTFVLISLLFSVSLTLEEGSQTVLFCAVDESVASHSGQYYDNCKLKSPNKLALDAKLAANLWNATLEVVGNYIKLAYD